MSGRLVGVGVGPGDPELLTVKGLRVLREAGLVDVHQEAQRRIYTLRPETLIEVDEWLGSYRALWQNRLDALHTEIARGKKSRK